VEKFRIDFSIMEEHEFQKYYKEVIREHRYTIMKIILFREILEKSKLLMILSILIATKILQQWIIAFKIPIVLRIKIIIENL
jgi:hypothetical protein